MLSKPVNMMDFTLVIKILYKTKVTEFCRCNQGLKSMNFKITKREVILVEMDLISGTLKMRSRPFPNEEISR